VVSADVKEAPLAKQNRAAKFQYTEQHHRRGDICPVGIADRDQCVLIETMLLAARNQSAVLARAYNIFFIETPVASRRKTRGTVFSKIFPRD